MKESTLQRRIQQAILARWPQAFIFKVHGGPYQAAGLPDLIFCIDGGFFGCEVKVPGKQPTKLQERTLQRIEHAGGIAFWTDDVDATIKYIADALE